MSELLKNKMIEYEVAPPEAVWEALSQELADQQFYAAVSRQLSAYKAEPPAESWQAILSGLETTPPKRIEIPKFMRWMAAAVISGILLAGSYYFINYIDAEDDQIASSSRTYPDSDPYRKPAPEKLGAASAPARPGASSPAYHPGERTRTGRKKLLASNEERPLRSSPIEEAEPLEDLPISISPGKIFSKNGELIQDMSIVNPQNSKYINITAPNGQQTRISSKLAIAMPYLGEPGAAQITGSYYWKQLIREWQEKIIHSSFVPSSLNFLDILEFSELIRE